MLLKSIMMKIPNIIDSSVPIGKDDSENVEIQKYGEPVVPSFEIPYHIVDFPKGIFASFAKLTTVSYHEDARAAGSDQRNGAS